MAMNTSTRQLLQISDAHKHYGTVEAVRGISLDVTEGEFLTFLGPSGCGKTTMLRMIAGFEALTRGEILLDGRPISQIEPYRRPVGMVFQNLALFPHLDVFENIAFGLRVRREAEAHISKQVRSALELVDLAEYGKRFIHQLSGGQKQRVALARALVLAPRILLLDEPLGAMDLKLRRQLQSELKDLQRRTGTTFLFVTHDQEEAMAMSDRIAVFRHGLIDQVGTPMDVYARPVTRFVADFVGDTNLLEGRIVIGGIEIADLGLKLPAATGSRVIGQQVAVSIRPEQVFLCAHDSRREGGEVCAQVVSVEYAGMYVKLRLRHSGTGKEIKACFALGEGSMAAVSNENDLVNLRFGVHALLDQ
jgi:putative spermidine/putrescine transport system ATP-binding protein